MNRREELLNSIKEMECSISRNNGDMTYEEMDDLVYRLESLALSCRRASSHMDLPDPLYETKSLRKLPLDIKVLEDEISIRIPYLFRRKGEYTQRNFMAANYVSVALKEYEAKSNRSLAFLFGTRPKKMVVTFDRGYNGPSKDVCDNDNVEAGRIINVIFGDYLLLSDSAENLDYYLTYHRSEEPETIISIQTKERFIEKEK